MHDVKRLICTLLLCLTSCSTFRAPSHSYLVDELANKGVIALSKENPFFAANLLVSKELAESEIGKGFISFRGTPDAVAVEKKPLRPLSVALYYLEKAQVYKLTKKADWLVDGPDPIPPSGLSALGSESPEAAGEPQVLEEPQEPHAADSLAEAPALSPPSKPASIEHHEEVMHPHTKVAPETDVGEPQIVDNSGDVLHRVRFAGETLRMIAKWYTGDTENADRLARINDVMNPNVLLMGQTLRIPRYLLTCTEPLTESEVHRYLTEIHGASH